MKTSVIGYPRIGRGRELKFAAEKYFSGVIDGAELQRTAKSLRALHLKAQAAAGIDFIPCGDFSFYDGMLDTAVMLGVTPARYKALRLSETDEYFAMARGYQGANGDEKALAMKKWFNTNYHYMVPEIEDGAEFTPSCAKLLNEFAEATALGITPKPVLIGPYTFLKLAKFKGKSTADKVAPRVAAAYSSLITRLAEAGARWIQIDEPSLVTDTDEDGLALFTSLYTAVLRDKGGVKILLQTYFGDVRDSYETLITLPFDGIGLDFIEGADNLALVKKHGFPQNAVLFAGVVNGRNIWRTDYSRAVFTLNGLKKHAPNVVAGTSCSLLHSPYTVANEGKLDAARLKYFAFAEEKLTELKDIAAIADGLPSAAAIARANDTLFDGKRFVPDKAVNDRVAALKKSDFTRLPDFDTRRKTQKACLNLPLLPTTTIGSFPQTDTVKRNRTAFKRGEITREKYDENIRGFIAECVAFQDKIGLDVLVHGEYERNDMVEYFGESLEGFLFTEAGWVQSYGTRCVKPPVIWGDVSRKKPITVPYITYAQGLTSKPLKGMLTGPVTILNWSFPREDVPQSVSAYQIALAVREEVLDLERNGIRIIQIDEAALREKLPLRRADRYPQYLDWAIPAFRLVHGGVKPETQIHTHMCYSEFGDIITDIEAMDADVISFEASRSDLAIIDALQSAGFVTEVGPGVYDIHSPRVPPVAEIEGVIGKMLKKIDPDKLWINPDCGLKTRGTPETESALKNLVTAARNARAALKK